MEVDTTEDAMVIQYSSSIVDVKISKRIISTFYSCVTDREDYVEEGSDWSISILTGKIPIQDGLKYPCFCKECDKKLTSGGTSILYYDSGSEQTHDFQLCRECTDLLETTMRKEIHGNPDQYVGSFL